MNYINYKIARNKAWEILINSGIDKLPVSVIKIAKLNGISVYNYSDNIEFFKNNNIIQYLHKDGFCLDDMIFYNDELPEYRKRFTIAHELGHILLRHLFSDCNEIEHQANIFASRILMPMCVLKELKISSPEQVSKLCNVSYQSAKIRFERLQILKKRDKFYTSSLEKKVLNNFLPYISYTKPILKE